jgi:hypothetical protein
MGANRRAEKITRQEASYFALFHRYYCGDQIEEEEMGAACSTHGEDYKCVIEFSRNN